MKANWQIRFIPRLGCVFLAARRAAKGPWKYSDEIPQHVLDYCDAKIENPWVTGAVMDRKEWPTTAEIKRKAKGIRWQRERAPILKGIVRVVEPPKPPSEGTIMRRKLHALNTLGDLYGVTGWERIEKAVERNTKCGAWVHLDPKTGIVRMGSIVEGVEETTQVFELDPHFSVSQFKRTLACVEREADDIWRATHGCAECGDPDPYEGGHIAINPECKSCKGKGVIK